MNMEKPSNWPETLSKIASAIQSIAVTVGLTIGGWWALKTYVFQNPRFYEKGFEIYGTERQAVDGQINIERISHPGFIFEITLVLENRHDTLDQVVNFDHTIISYFDINDRSVASAKPSMISTEQAVVLIPVGERRKIHFLIDFKHEGTFLLEFNPCVIGNQVCPIQKYANVSRN